MSTWVDFIRFEPLFDCVKPVDDHLVCVGPLGYPGLVELIKGGCERRFYRTPQFFRINRISRRGCR